jgi:hypothetical protein
MGKRTTYVARRKADPTGRSIGFVGGSVTISTKPPAGEPWVWFSKKMLASPAFRALGINGYRVLFFICHEQCLHAGQENGQLFAPYNQLESWGCSRSEIAAAIDELVALGWLEMQRGARLEGRPGASRYRLTWLAASDGSPPTNRWAKVTTADVALFEAERREDRLKSRTLKSARRTPKKRVA